MAGPSRCGKHTYPKNTHFTKGIRKASKAVTRHVKVIDVQKSHAVHSKTHGFKRQTRQAHVAFQAKNRMQARVGRDGSQCGKTGEVYGC